MKNLLSVNVGMPVEMQYKGKSMESGIIKTSTHEPLYVSTVQVEGDGQADRVHHGGPEKAICVYSYEHYPYWEEKLNRNLSPGAFGENFTVSGLDEHEARIGDVYRIGEILVQVSLPRKPCYKLASKFGVEDMAKQVTDNGFSGYYLRVLKEGYVTTGEKIIVDHRPDHDVTVAMINRLTYHDRQDRTGLEQAMLAKELSEDWYHKLSKQLSAL
ncbi:MOSC domain-containing protein [Guptibacillus algicola]|uniref:MOSC domain-containing protein n=1 Tax=Guptibacillus algicola TaxID=225844 RepID=UPI001CD57FA8|nr:MOSC domain-containing protein [Alkalihalobacillus algicola]MCA0986721.1 MOSC domain-containing protein [Alkalihalobacillus algicola]